jgi:hypothetical protein
MVLNSTAKIIQAHIYIYSFNGGNTASVSVPFQPRTFSRVSALIWGGSGESVGAGLRVIVAADITK